MIKYSVEQLYISSRAMFWHYLLILWCRRGSKGSQKEIKPPTELSGRIITWFELEWLQISMKYYKPTAKLSWVIFISLNSHALPYSVLDIRALWFLGNYFVKCTKTLFSCQTRLSCCQVASETWYAEIYLTLFIGPI